MFYEVTQTVLLTTKIRVQAESVGQAVARATCGGLEKVVKKECYIDHEITKTPIGENEGLSVIEISYEDAFGITV